MINLKNLNISQLKDLQKRLESLIRKQNQFIKKILEYQDKENISNLKKNLSK